MRTKFQELPATRRHTWAWTNSSTPAGATIGATFATGMDRSWVTEPPSSSTMTSMPAYVKSSPYVCVTVNVPTAAGGSWLEVRAIVSICPVPQSRNAVWLSTQPGSENVTAIVAGDPSFAPVIDKERICGGAFAIAYAAVALAVSSPSETSTVTVPVVSSPNVSGGEIGEALQPVSHVPSLWKSHRYVRESPSMSVEALALNVIGVPSTPVYGPPRAAAGAAFTWVTSRTGIAECASIAPSAFASTSALGRSARPA